MSEPFIIRQNCFNETEHVTKEVWSGKKWYSSIRKNGQRAVCVKWDDNTNTIEPVCNLIDFSKEEINDKMIKVLTNWKIAEEKFNRDIKCAFCEEYSNKYNFLCQDCDKKTSWIKVFINLELISRENKLCNTNTIDNIIRLNKKRYMECEVIEETFLKYLKI